MSDQQPDPNRHKLYFYVASFIFCAIAGVAVFIYDLVSVLGQGLTGTGLPFLTSLICAWVCWVFARQIKRLSRPPDDSSGG